MSAQSAYEELVKNILIDEDRDKFEQFIGRVLSGGPKGCFVIQGMSGTGKSTLMEIAQMVLKDVWNVEYLHDGFRMSLDETVYQFVAVNQAVYLPEGSVMVRTFPTKKLGAVEFHALKALVAVESETISRLCREQYRRLTETNQEN